MRFLVPWLLAAAAPVLAAPATTVAIPKPSLDHVLLWGRTIDQITAVMAAKLGLQVRPGHDQSGIANRYVRFADGSYIELLGLSRPDPDLDPGAAADQRLLKGGAGARSMALRTVPVDQARQAVMALGWKPTPVFEGPKLADGRAGWRLFGFEQQPLSSNIFLIDYHPDWAPDLSATPASGDWQAARVHPNGATALDSYWLLSANAAADRRALQAMGLGAGKPVHMPGIAAKGYCFTIGRKSIVAVEPDGAGIAADDLRTGGTQVLGASIAVSDLGQTQRIVERGYETRLTRYAGLAGAAILAPTQNDLGMVLEFHTAAPLAGPCDG